MDREADVQALPAANDSNLRDTGPTTLPPSTAALAEEFAFSKLSERQ